MLFLFSAACYDPLILLCSAGHVISTSGDRPALYSVLAACAWKAKGRSQAAAEPMPSKEGFLS